MCGDFLDLDVLASRVGFVEFEGFQDLKQFNISVGLLGSIGILSK